MDVMLENYLRRMESNQVQIIKLLEGISAELCFQREHRQIKDETHTKDISNVKKKDMIFVPVRHLDAD